MVRARPPARPREQSKGVTQLPASTPAGIDELSCITNALWTDRGGRTTVVGFLLAKGWRASCRAARRAALGTTSPWDGRVLAWRPIEPALMAAMVEEGYDDCSVLQCGYDNCVPQRWEGGQTLGFEAVNELTARGRLRTCVVHDATTFGHGALEDDGGARTRLVVLRDVATDRILILNEHDARQNAQQRQVSFDMWHMASCVRYFSCVSAEPGDQVPMLASAIEDGKQRTFSARGIGRAQSRAMRTGPMSVSRQSPRSVGRQRRLSP